MEYPHHQARTSSWRWASAMIRNRPGGPSASKSGTTSWWFCGRRRPEADLASVQKVAAGAGRLHLQFYLDQEQGRLLVFSAGGEKLADLTVPDDKSLPVVHQGPAEVALEAPQRQARLAGRLATGEPRRRLSSWSGSRSAAGAARLRRAWRPASPESIRRTASFATRRSSPTIPPQGSSSFPSRAPSSVSMNKRLHDLVLSQPGEAAARPLRALQASGSAGQRRAA